MLNALRDADLQAVSLSLEVTEGYLFARPLPAAEAAELLDAPAFGRLSAAGSRHPVRT